MTQIELALPTAMTVERLAECEGVVRNALASYQAAGQALIEIRDSQGYKLKGHRTFEDYCEKEFGASDRHARRLIEGAQTAEKVQAVLGAAPRNEGVARELRSVADKPEMLQRINAKLAGKKTTLAKATAETVAAVVAQVTGKNRAPKPAAKAATKPSGKGVQAPMLVEAPPPPLAEVSDICPHCQVTPDAYTRDTAGWHCGACGGLVVVSVIAAKAEKCPSCDQPVQANEVFCANCGGAL